MFEPDGCPMDEVEDGRKRKEQFCIDSNRDICMGSDQLTAFKDLRYGISVPYDPVVRGNLLCGGMGDRNALLRSSSFFVIPHQLQAAAFASCRRVVSLQPHTMRTEACLNRLQHPSVSQAVHPTMGARSGDFS